MSGIRQHMLNVQQDDHIIPSKMARDIDEGWAWVVTASAFWILFLHGGVLYGIGVVYVELFDAYPDDQSKVVLACSLFTSLSCFVGPISGVLADRFSCRVAMLAGSVLAFVGMTMSAFVNDINVLIFTFGFIAGSAQGLYYIPTVIIIGFYFDKKRNLAGGISAAGVGVGLMVFPPMMRLIAVEYGPTGLILILASCYFQISVFSALCRPSSLEKEQLCEQKHSASDKIIPSSKSWLKKILNKLRFALSKSFVALTLCLSTNGFAVSIIFMYLPSYAILNGSSKQDAALLLSYLGVSLVIARIAVGYAASIGNFVRNQYGWLCGTTLIGSIATLTLPLYIHSYIGRICYSVMFGAFTVAPFALVNSVTLDVVGLLNLPIAFGTLMCFSGASYLMGPAITGLSGMDKLSATLTSQLSSG